MMVEPIMWLLAFRLVVMSNSSALNSGRCAAAAPRGLGALARVVAHVE
jgi:hypothetical protein